MANAVVTNYAYWVRANALGRGLEVNAKQGEPNPFEVMILDEGHTAAEQLANSLKEQTYTNFELIVIDDGSDDDTERICKSLQKNGFIDYDKVAEITKKFKPKLIIAGTSAYPRILDFKKQL